MTIRRFLSAALLTLVSVIGATPALAQDPGTTSTAALAAAHEHGARVQYPMRFPLAGPDVYYNDDDSIGFGSCRAGCSRFHEGLDMLAPKMTEVYAVADGVVSWLGSTCCSVGLQHDDGWASWYIHMNNDTPGTDDGAGWGYAPGIVPGARVSAGQLLGWVGDSGNAETTAPHVHFELHDAHGVKVDPYLSVVAAQGIGICGGSTVSRMLELTAYSGVVQLGSAGPQVFELQGFLATRGYRLNTVDGTFGRSTDRAVRAFQARADLDVDGLVGPMTRAAIGVEVRNTAFASMMDLHGPVLAMGASSPQVAELKRWLSAAGFDPGDRPYTNDFDGTTAAALRSFQAWAGLPIDGTLTPATRAALQARLGLLRSPQCPQSLREEAWNLARVEQATIGLLGGL